MHRSSNQFQLDVGALREMMAHQIGARGTLPTQALNGWWECGDTFGVCITKPSHRGRFVAEGLCDDGNPIELTASILLHVDARMQWQPLPEHFLQRWKAEVLLGKHHRNSMRRASEFMSLCVEQGVTSDDVVLTLDGNGENRSAMRLEAPQGQAPEIFNVEVDANVALAQQLLFGGVIFSAADPTIRSKNAVKKCRSPTTLVEHLLIKPNNRLLTDETKLRTKGLYLDYCGGPLANQSPDVCHELQKRILGSLPNLRVFGITMSKRRHPQLVERFAEYVPVPYGFERSRIFVDNARVVCHLYVRTAGIRALSVPGAWWKQCPSHLKKRTFVATVVGTAAGASKYEVFVPFDANFVTMRSDAVAAYASEAKRAKC